MPNGTETFANNVQNASTSTQKEFAARSNLNVDSLTRTLASANNATKDMDLTMEPAQFLPLINKLTLDAKNGMETTNASNAL